MFPSTGERPTGCPSSISFFPTFVSVTSFFSVGLPLLVLLTVPLVLHLLAKAFLLSSCRRSRHLFAGTPWLPLRFEGSCSGGQDVEFATSDDLTLRGTYFSTPKEQRRGVVLFCHELNGHRHNVAPFLEPLLHSGFDLLTFDFRNHGQSDKTTYGHPMPWTTQSDVEDVKAAIDYLQNTSRNTSCDLQSPQNDNEISIFGLGKGATVALCVAGSDDRVKSVVLDAPIPENRLFEKNCWELFFKAIRSSRRSVRLSVSLFFKAVLYSFVCPINSLRFAWRRFILGKWYGCQFVNPWPLAKQVRQPMMIIHGHADSQTRADQIQAFCDRMANKPRLWMVPACSREGYGQINEECSSQVARFFVEQHG